MKTKFLLFTLFFLAAMQVKANNMLVKNVTTSGDNATNKSIQVQFDMSWDNSWRDGINWDAAWVFMKYKDASGNWQHVQLNTTGFVNGSGTANMIQVGSDKVGAFVYRSSAGTGTFASTSMQLQWNYGLSGLTSVIGLEIRVFAVEMVYVPQGDFTIRSDFFVHSMHWESNYQPWDNSYYYCCEEYQTNSGSITATPGGLAVVNSRLTPKINYNDSQNPIQLRIKGNSGIDSNNDEVVDNTIYPVGFSPFYSFKYEMSEQQYADFLNTLSASQIQGIGVAGVNIFNSNGQYFTSSPNRACGNGNIYRLLAYADWSGLRPMTILEFNKANNGPLFPVGVNYSYIPWWMNNNLNNVGSLATNTSNRLDSGGSYYGIMDFTGNAFEPCVKLNYYSFTNANGNGVIGANGEADVSNWISQEFSRTTTGMIIFIDLVNNNPYPYGYPNNNGFRYVRSAE